MFSATFRSQIYVLVNLLFPFIRCRYIHLNEKEPDVVKPRVKLYGFPERWTCINPFTKHSNLVHRLHVNACLKAIFSGISNITSATKTFFRWIILYMEGYWNHSKRGILWKVIIWTIPNHKRAFTKKNPPFILVIAFQKGESVCFGCTWDNVLDWRYLFYSISSHTPFSLIN